MFKSNSYVQKQHEYKYLLFRMSIYFQNPIAMMGIVIRSDKCLVI